MGQLKELDVDYNYLTKNPMWVKQLPHLNNLLIEHNPIVLQCRDCFCLYENICIK